MCPFRIFKVYNLAARCEKCPVERDNLAILATAERGADEIFVLPSRDFIAPELQAEINAILRAN